MLSCVALDGAAVCVVCAGCVLEAAFAYTHTDLHDAQVPAAASHARANRAITKQHVDDLRRDGFAVVHGACPRESTHGCTPYPSYGKSCACAVDW